MKIRVMNAYIDCRIFGEMDGSGIADVAQG